MADSGSTDPGAAEREGIVDQQAAALAKSEDADAAPADHEPLTEVEREGIVDQQAAAAELSEPND